MKEEFLRKIKDGGIEICQEIVENSPELPNKKVFEMLLESAKNGNLEDLDILQERLAGWLDNFQQKNCYQTIK